MSSLRDRVPGWRRGVELMALLLALSCASAPAAPTRSPYELVLPAHDTETYDFVFLKGKVALVYFFATWCMPCLMELKTLTALQHQYETKGFSVVAVGMDLEGRRLLAPFAQSYQFPFPVLVASDEVRSGQSPYGTILKVPTTVLLDRQGHVVAAVEGISDPAGLQRTVADLLR